ncbi:MAG: CtsR family transcriptional regulator [Acutalibacteraceae bacterium]|nr:CtsR family transcriptional regulator [Acutalibacteraceae bacterium]
MNLSNAIAQIITEMLQDKNEIEIQRNILAQDLGCVPSQINYVLSSRFTPERGFIVESRRGGGGCIRITRISYDKSSLMMQVVNSVGGRIDEATAKNHLINLVYHKLISQRDAALILAACSDVNFKILPAEIKDTVRASLLKQMLLTVIKE